MVHIEAPARIQSLFRYPIKGLNGEALQSAHVEAGGGLPLDRAYAIAHGVTQFDPQAPVYLQKIHFLALMTHPRLAELHVSFRESDHEIRVARRDVPEFVTSLTTEQGRAEFATYLDEFIGSEAKGRPRVVTAHNHMFTDIRDRCLSVQNLASIAALGAQAGLKLDPLRFRANVYLTGLAPWVERTWEKGAVFSLGEVRLRVLKPISRCNAINVDLDTARIDSNLPLLLRERFEGNYMGVYAQVIDGGTVHEGAVVTVPTPGEIIA